MDGYVDLALSAEDAEKQYASNTTLADVQKYPWGTSFSLDEKTLDKIDHEDWKVSDIFHFHVMAKITGINSNETPVGEKKCVNFQMTAIRGESEGAEDEEEEHEEEDEEDEEDGIKHEGGYSKYAS